MYLNLKSIIPSTKLLILTISTAFLFTESYAQLRENYKADIEVQAIGTTNGTVPFWMRSNQFGSIPLSGVSGGVSGRFSKNYAELTPNEEVYGKDRLIDWGFGFEGRANGGKNSNLQLIEAYVKAKASIFQLKAGRTKDVMGLNGDTSLSSGNFAVSGNALGIPRIELSIPEYWRVPIFDGLFSIKGNFTHGWLGRTRILDSIGSLPPSKVVYYVKNNHPISYLHQKSLYVRLGKPEWRLQLYGGFSHQVYWGNEKDAYGDNFKLSPLETFIYVATGKPYGSQGVPTSKIGNQLGSIDLGAEMDFENFKIMVYRQNFYDVGALSKLANIADGLNGVSIENKNYSASDGGFQVSKLLFEFFYSTDQAGYPWSTPTKSGDEDYYNNFYYLNGWSYYGLGVGNPLITPRSLARDGQAFRENDFFINNRVVAIHLGLNGHLKDWSYKTKLSYSWNHGTFGTSKYGNSTGGVDRVPRDGDFFVPVQQFSFYLESMRALDNGYKIGFVTAFDQGHLLKNSFGGSIRLTKEF